MHLCRVDKHIQTFAGWFYEVMTRLWKVLNLSYENGKAKLIKYFVCKITFHWLKI